MTSACLHQQLALPCISCIASRRLSTAAGLSSKDWASNTAKARSNSLGPGLAQIRATAAFRANRDLPDKELSRLCELALGEAWAIPAVAAPVNEMICNMRRGLRPNASRLVSQSSTAKVSLQAVHLARKQLGSCVCLGRAAGGCSLVPPG